MPKLCSTGHALGSARTKFASFVVESNLMLQMKLVLMT